MTYEQQILQLLTIVGERGISVSSMTKHVYNQSRTLFHQPDIQEINQYVQQYLLSHSKSAQSLIESTGKRGYYRLNAQNSVAARQLMFDFRESNAQTENPSEDNFKKDYSLSLFPDEE